MAMCEAQHELGPDKRWAAYREALTLYIARRLSKRKLDSVVLRTVGLENVRRHNDLILALLRDAAGRAHANRTAKRRRSDGECDECDAAVSLTHRQRPKQDGPEARGDARAAEAPSTQAEAVAPARLRGAATLGGRMNELAAQKGCGGGATPAAAHVLGAALEVYVRRIVAGAQTAQQ
ncbi:hypothetical protein M885DRAFT_507276 [Pelagophyceae sp. CCMP2097]|nr:hypothetical protein M885DRAFT_507276 [Pelagophyceae sp. CCMP2097]